MVCEDEFDALQTASKSSTLQSDSVDLRALTSSRKEVRSTGAHGAGALQAYACSIRNLGEISRILEAFETAVQRVASCSYAYRISQESEGNMQEGAEDGLDEGCGEKILSVLRRASLQGILLIVARWQEHGRTPALELFGLEIYAPIVELCKELIAKLRGPAAEVPSYVQESKKKSFDFSALPPLPEPRVATKFGPNHFLYDTEKNKPRSLRSLLGGGDVQMWMANDEALRHLQESELWTLRSLRQPDPRIEKVLHAVALLRQQSPLTLSGDPAARWGNLLAVLKSPTLRTELLLFDARSVPLETAKNALALLDTMHSNDVRRASPAASALFDWAQRIAQLRCSDEVSPLQALGALEELAPLKPREADLSLPKLSRRTQRSRAVRGCKVLDRSRSAALLGMTLI